MNNNEKLLRIANDNKLTKLDLSILLKTKTTTIEKWRQKKDSNGYRNVSDTTLELLRLLIYVKQTVPKAELEAKIPTTFYDMKKAGLL